MQELKIKDMEPGNIVLNCSILMAHYGLIRLVDEDGELFDCDGKNLAFDDVEPLIGGLVRSWKTWTPSRQNPKPTRVTQGKYKSALFYLWRSDEAGGGRIQRCQEDRTAAEIYFPRDLVLDSKQNRYTAHRAIDDVFTNGSVIIEVHRQKA